MNIEKIKKSSKRIDNSTILSLIQDLIIPNLEDIVQFSETDIYFTGDIVYLFDINENKHMLFKCKENGVTGKFDKELWSDFTIALGGSSGGSNLFSDYSIQFIEEEDITITENKTREVTIESSNYNSSKSEILVFINGVMVVDRNMVSKIPNTNKVRFVRPLMKDDKVSFMILTLGEKNVFNKINTSSIVLGTSLTEVVLPISGFNLITDKLFISSAKKSFISYQDYTVSKNENNENIIYFKSPLDKDDVLCMVSFSKLGSKTYNRVYSDNILTTIDNQSIIEIPSNLFKTKNSQIIVLDNKRFLNQNIDYNIIDDKFIEFLNPSYPSGTLISTLIISDLYNPDDVISDDTVELRHLSSEFKDYIIPIKGLITLSLTESRKTVTLDRELPDTSYIIDMDIKSTSGDVGDIKISNCTRNTFDIEMSGIAKEVILEYRVKRI